MTSAAKPKRVRSREAQGARPNHRVNGRPSGAGACEKPADAAVAEVEKHKNYCGGDRNPFQMWPGRNDPSRGQIREQLIGGFLSQGGVQMMMRLEAPKPLTEALVAIVFRWPSSRTCAREQFPGRRGG